MTKFQLRHTDHKLFTKYIQYKLQVN